MPDPEHALTLNFMCVQNKIKNQYRNHSNSQNIQTAFFTNQALYLYLVTYLLIRRSQILSNTLRLLSKLFPPHPPLPSAGPVMSRQLIFSWIKLVQVIHIFSSVQKIDLEVITLMERKMSENNCVSLILNPKTENKPPTRFSNIGQTHSED